MTALRATAQPAAGLIPINQSDGKPTVNARDLHAFLCSRQDFSTWIKGRIDQYGFLQGIDYALHKFVERGTTKIDYHVSLDMAKELSMVERTAKGKQARMYFIECEKRALSSPAPVPALDDPAALRAVLLGYTEKVLELQAEVQAKVEVIEGQAPKVQALKRIAEAEGSLCP